MVISELIITACNIDNHTLYAST